MEEKRKEEELEDLELDDLELEDLEIEDIIKQKKINRILLRLCGKVTKYVRHTSCGCENLSKNRCKLKIFWYNCFTTGS